MRAVAAIFVLLCAVPVSQAFDSDAWLAKRSMMRREAGRLREAYRRCADSPVDAAEGVSVPIETHPDGSVKLSVEAKRAKFFLREGLVWAEGVVMRKTDENGGETTRIEAARCVIDRETRGGWAEGPLKMTLGQTVLTGENVFFAASEGYVASSTNSAIVSTDMKMGGLL